MKGRKRLRSGAWTIRRCGITCDAACFFSLQPPWLPDCPCVPFQGPRSFSMSGRGLARLAELGVLDSYPCAAESQQLRARTPPRNHTMSPRQSFTSMPVHFPRHVFQNHSRKAESDSVFSTSTPCRPSIHHDHGRYLEAMAGPPRRHRCPIVDRHRRAWNEGGNIQSA